MTNGCLLGHLSFQELVRSQPHFHCVWFKKPKSKTQERKRCGCNLFKKAPKFEKQLARVLSGQAHTKAELLGLFQELARYSLCGKRRHHRNQEIEQVYEKMAKSWAEEFPELDLTAIVVEAVGSDENAISNERQVKVSEPPKRQKSKRRRSSRNTAWKRTTSNDRITLYDAAIDAPTDLLSPPTAPQAFSRTRPSSFIPFNPHLPLCSTYRSQYINHKITSYLRRPLTPQKSSSLGHIYIFTRPCDPGYVKIGYTGDEPELRIARWGQECSYEAEYQFATVKFANAYQVEQLVHRELEAVRVRERVCKYGKGRCEREHSEWFKVDVEIAKKVIKRWAGWALGLQLEDERSPDTGVMLGETTTDHLTPWSKGKESLHDDWKTLLADYTVALDDGHHEPAIWEKWARKEKIRASPTPDQPVKISCCEPSVAPPLDQDALIKQILALSQMQLYLAVKLSNASPAERAQAAELITSLPFVASPIIELTTPLPQTPIARPASPDIFVTPQSSPALLPSPMESPPELDWGLSSPLSDPFGPPTPSPGPQYSSVSGHMNARSVMGKV